MNFAPTLPSPHSAIAALLAAFALLPTGKSWAFAVDSSAQLCHHATRASDIRGALDYLPPPCMAAAVRPAQETSSRLLRNPGLTALDQLIQRTDPLGGITRFAYDTLGNKLSETDPEGRTTSYQG